MQFNPVESVKSLKAQVYLEQLDIIATSIVRRISHAQRQNVGEAYVQLSVLIFGSAESEDTVMADYMHKYIQGPITYKVRRKQTEFGTITKAKRMDSALMKYEEPIAYVVDEDVDQGLSLESYLWGSRQPQGSS